MREREDEWRPDFQHSMDLAKNPVEIVHVPEGIGREHEVDRVRPQESKICQIAVAELDPHLLPFAQPFGEGQLLSREVNTDRGRALPDKGDRALRTPAAKLEHALTLQVS